MYEVRHEYKVHFNDKQPVLYIRKCWLEMFGTASMRLPRYAVQKAVTNLRYSQRLK